MMQMPKSPSGTRRQHLSSEDALAPLSARFPLRLFFSRRGRRGRLRLGLRICQRRARQPGVVIDPGTMTNHATQQRTRLDRPLVCTR
jgi:hypothetical protein